jgi:hypothetical protein
MVDQLTVAQRRRRMVDSAAWAVLLTVLLFLLVPIARTFSASWAAWFLALCLYVPLFAAAIDVTFRYFGMGAGGYDVVRPNVWAGVLLGFWVTIGVPAAGGLLRLWTLSVAYLLCEHLLPESQPATA